VKDLREGVTDLQNLLAVDDTKRHAASPDRLEASLGADASRFLSVGGLLTAFSRRTGRPSGMDSARRSRCETALSILEAGLRRQLDSPDFVMFQSGPDPCAEALVCCEQQLLESEPLLRALRIARLEAVSAYDPAHHDEALGHFGWRTADPHEIAAMTVPVAVETAARISLDSLSRLLLSGHPVQVLIPNTDDALPDLGAIALAYRSAFVAQTSPARWEHLSKTFEEMARTLHPAVMVADSQPSRLYRYDPDRAGFWKDRFQLEPPAPAEPDDMLSALAEKPAPANVKAAPAEDSAAIREQAAKDAYMRVIAMLSDPASFVQRS
jgi:hypothetical protein